MGSWVLPARAGFSFSRSPSAGAGAARPGRVVFVVLGLAVGCGGHGTAMPASPVAGPVRIGEGRSLYVTCVGAGRPTVVLEAGFPGASDTWSDVQPRLGRTSRTCAYDRAGL